MPQSLSKVLVHLIFSTKHREPLISPEVRPRLHAYLVGILANLKSPSLQTGGVADHVHVLFALGRTISQSITRACFTRFSSMRATFFSSAVFEHVFESFGQGSEAA